MIRLGNNEILKTLMKTLTFVDAEANAKGSTIALRERYPGELKNVNIVWLENALYLQQINTCISRAVSRYHIRPNYCTVCLGFSNYLENL